MPVDRSAIDAQLRDIGEGERWWEQREFRDLPHILHADERIKGIINGKFLGSRMPRIRPAASWLIVATDQRLICLKRERFARKQVDILGTEITRIHQSTRVRSCQITVATGLRRYRLRIPKADAFRFAGAIAPLVPNPPVSRVSLDLGPFAWVPGINAVAALPGVASMVSKVSLLSPPPDYATASQLRRLEATVEVLQQDLERLQEQVTFLEDLLQTRAEEAYLPRSPADS